MMKRRKVFISLGFCLIMIISVSMPCLAANFNDEMTQTADFYAKNSKVLESWNENLVLAASGKIDGVTPIAVVSDDTAAGYAKVILNSFALKIDEDARKAAVDALVALQADDGSFGDIYSSIYPIIALKSAKADFKADDAVKWVLTKQFADGGFSWDGATEGDLDTTAMVLNCLSAFTDKPSVKDSIAKAKDFIKSQLQENGGFVVWGMDNSNTLAVVITALIDIGENVNSDEWNKMGESLLRFKNGDASYRLAPDFEEVNDSYSTMSALGALYSLKNNASLYKQLMTNQSLGGGFVLDSTVLLIGIAAVILIAIVVFVFVVLRKKD